MKLNHVINQSTQACNCRAWEVFKERSSINLGQRNFFKRRQPDTVQEHWMAVDDQVGDMVDCTNVVPWE